MTFSSISIPKNWLFAIGIAVIIIGSWIFAPSFEAPVPSPSPSPVSGTPQENAGGSLSVTPRTLPRLTTRLTSITPPAGKINTQITLKGSGFSRTGNTIIFTAKDKNTNPWYILKAANFLSTDEGTTIVMGVSPTVFIYGDCPTTETFCNAKVSKLEPGEYTVRIQPANCPPAQCMSNGIQFLLVQ